ncbi:MAG: CAP domain-containing protein [Planctomycetes bacterium]|nr:CAP domain-containing protein [Planctomycetota bacterium]
MNHRFLHWLPASLLFALLCGPVLAEPESPATETPAQQATPAPEQPDLDVVKTEIFTLTNQFRQEQGRAQLKENPALAKAAQYFAEYMARTDKFSHTADDKQPWDRAVRYGYQYCVVAENIGYEYSSAGFSTQELGQAFITGWKNSPHHRANMLDTDLTEIGIGVAHSSETGRFYAVQDFGRPKSAMVSFTLINRTEAPVKYTVNGKSFTIEPRYRMMHESCRAPEVAFPSADDEEDQTFRPHKGSRFILTRDEQDHLVIREQ